MERFLILEYKRVRNLWLKRKKAKWVGQRRQLDLFLNKPSRLNETLPYLRIKQNTMEVDPWLDMVWVQVHQLPPELQMELMALEEEEHLVEQQTN